VISELIGARIRNSTLRLGEALSRWGLTPNLLTGIGLVLNLIVAAVIARGSLWAGGALLLLASGFDMLDGAVARASGTVTKFGGFLDSTIDRYSESLVYGGVLVYLLALARY
jgi:CDP-diacylglycerol--glycerol-3-phosphate 3-phosphatidyltransferase